MPIALDHIMVPSKNKELASGSLPHGADDGQVNISLGGKIIYCDESDGRVLELLTKSYARVGLPRRRTKL